MNYPETKDNPFGNTEVNYPARVAMKAITFSNYTEEEHKIAIKKVLATLQLISSEWKKKKSKAGKYVSYSFTVEIPDKIKLEKMYSMLNDLDVVKMLL